MGDNPWTESSDFVARYQALKATSTSTDSISNPVQPPASVVSRLTALSLTWSDLDVVDKQALLWDMGFVRSNALDPDALTQVYTRCTSNSSSVGAGMASIALSKEVFDSSQSDATTTSCQTSMVQGVNTTYFRQNNSDGRKLGPLTNCYIANDTSIAGSHSSMWSQDGQGLSAYPLPNVMRHEWNFGYFWLVFAIHTEMSTTEIGHSFCGPPTAPGGVTIPCRVFDNSPPEGWCIPGISTTMTQVLAQIALTKPNKTPTPEPTTGGSNLTAAIVGATIGILVAIAAIGIWLWLRRHRQRTAQLASTVPNAESRQRTASTQPKSYQPIQTASQTLNEFQLDPVLTSKRLPYSSVVYSRVLSKGAFGEVWLGTYNGKVVAIKRLLESKRTSEAEIGNFADEIRLMASFSHPNIVTFIGFAWDSLQNLCAVTEYMPQGDLCDFVQLHTQLQWRRQEKVKIALGIANALAYLHNLSHPIIHRDLKAKNAKLSDFGISRERATDEAMTAGVGTVFWTAPEVLTDKHYSEQADVYSFGIVLNEIDTGAGPYADMKSVAQLTMVHRITLEGLRPTFSGACPPQLLALANKCLLQDPEQRPTARELVAALSDWT
ncbi:protein kinase [Achlya hypogyna]|uniref:Protein kinase n=1 Tax=Achlya hypogyna TaxID=1202772 RepID=A0A1V9YP33_ACHHY|nr:protein kinase [Achlya hypogyna]